MLKETETLLNKAHGFDPELTGLVNDVEKQLQPYFAKFDEITEYNQIKVLDAFHKNHISDSHFSWQNGYGHGDQGREILGKTFADIFKAEKCIVGPFISDGTHALSCTYLGLLRSGDELLYCTGAPYDTMQTIIGITGSESGTLKEYGVQFAQVELDEKNNIDLDAVKSAIKPNTLIAVVQRSLGYSYRHAFSTAEIREWVKACKSVKPDIICMVDNCYGEFLDVCEPLEAGADIMASSLMKNPGGGIAHGGGYIAGRAELVDKVANRVICPGLGCDSGLMYDQTRRIFQGIFNGPAATNAAVKSAMLFAAVFKRLGYETIPDIDDPRNDIVTAIKMKNEDQLMAFAKAVQAAAPVNADFVPEAGLMSGYQDKIVMASGSFIQGSTMELSCDAPLREPYIVYVQGAVSYPHGKYGCIAVLNELKKTGLL